MTREQELALLIATAQKAGEAALEQGSHALAIQALLSAFATIATSHSCCTTTAARLAQAVANNLHQRALARTQPASNQVH